VRGRNRPGERAFNGLTHGGVKDCAGEPPLPLSDAQDYPLWINALIFAFAAACVWGAGTRLTVSLDAIALKTGLGQAFVGMLLLGGITSLPEVANVITSSWTGNPGLAVNNLLGSAAINVLLLALADAFIGREALTSAVAKPSTMMMATLCILVLIAVATAIAAGDVPVLGVGVWSVLICAMSIGAFWLSASYGRRAQWIVEGEPQTEEETEENHESGMPLRSLVVRSGILGAVIFVAGYALSQTGDAIAEQTGLGTGMVGFALIGISTSMPELSSITTAIRMRRYEMAFGQILGTNFVNLSLILLADVFFAGGPVVSELGRFEQISALLGASLVGIFMVGLLERKDSTIMKMGYDSAVVILLFGAGLAVLATV